MAFTSQFQNPTVETASNFFSNRQKRNASTVQSTFESHIGQMDTLSKEDKWSKFAIKDMFEPMSLRDKKRPKSHARATRKDLGLSK